MSLLRRGFAYGTAVFAAGFIFGTLRELVLIPSLGARAGTWLEFAAMLIATIVIAGWLVARVRPRMSTAQRLAMGGIGTLILIALESSLALLVFGLPLSTYLASYNLANGALLPLGLMLMAVAPALIVRH